MGTIAELYNNIGGEVIILGKPSIEIYSTVLKNFKDVNNSKILAIGDSIYHDIKGANNFGIDSLLITSTGIHHSFFSKELPKWENSKNSLKKLNILPKYICSELIF